MGIYAHRFYFKQELPKVSAIEEKFQEITGLRLQFSSEIHLDELMTDSDDLLYHLKKRYKKTRSSVIATPCFSCEGFDDIWLGDYIQPETRSFYLETGIGMKSKYFFLALIKAVQETGGYTFRYSYYPHEEDLDIDQYLEPYYSHERKWKRIRKWDEMCDAEKAAFKGKYSE